MTNMKKDFFQRAVLMTCGILTGLVFLLSLGWSVGWQWKGSEGVEYIQMIGSVYLIHGIFVL